MLFGRGVPLGCSPMTPKEFSKAKWRFFDALVRELTGNDVRVAWRILDRMSAERPFSYPSIGLLARELGCDDRSVQRSVKRLVESGWFYCEVGGGCKRPNSYKPNLERVTPVSPLEDERVTPVSPLEDERVTAVSPLGVTPVSPFKDGKGDISGQKGDISDRKGGISCQKRVTPLSPKPLKRTLFESGSESGTPRSDNGAARRATPDGSARDASEQNGTGLTAQNEGGLQGEPGGNATAKTYTELVDLRVADPMEKALAKIVYHLGHWSSEERKVATMLARASETPGADGHDEAVAKFQEISAEIEAGWLAPEERP